MNVQPAYKRVTLHLKDGIMVSKGGTRYKRVQVNWYFDSTMTIEGMREGSEGWERIQ